MFLKDILKKWMDNKILLIEKVMGHLKVTLESSRVSSKKSALFNCIFVISMRVRLPVPENADFLRTFFRPFFGNRNGCLPDLPVCSGQPNGSESEFIIFSSAEESKVRVPSLFPCVFFIFLEIKGQKWIDFSPGTTYTNFEHIF